MGHMVEGNTEFNFATMNMISVDIKRFTNLIEEEFKYGNMTPIMGIGKSGIGKTEAIFELTQKHKWGFKEIRLVTMTETDILGIPEIVSDDSGQRFTSWVQNKLLPTLNDGEKGILVLDEITSAQSSVRASAYQLMDSKRALAEYKLPDGWMVVALGNGPDDGGVFQGMEYASLSRAKCFRVEPQFLIWKEWAQNKGVHPSILAYLAQQPVLLHKMNPDDPAQVFPCPRTWYELSKMLNAREKDGRNLVEDKLSLEIYAASCVGVEIAASFAAFFQYNKEVLNVEDVINGKADTDIAKYGTEVTLILAQNLVKIVRERMTSNQLTETEKIKVAANVCSWISKAGKSSLDTAFLILNELNSIDAFSNIVIDMSFEEEHCPEFGEFISANARVFNASKRGPQ